VFKIVDALAKRGEALSKVRRLIKKSWQQYQKLHVSEGRLQAVSLAGHINVLTCLHHPTRCGIDDNAESGGCKDMQGEVSDPTDLTPNEPILA
jgi:hypothetical protein